MQTRIIENENHSKTSHEKDKYQKLNHIYYNHCSTNENKIQQQRKRSSCFYSLRWIASHVSRGLARSDVVIIHTSKTAKLI